MKKRSGFSTKAAAATLSVLHLWKFHMGWPVGFFKYR
jgi:hypothetical protein